ncbi:MAG TPA: cyclic nucleotide-binding domain-containing protein [Candidatus Dormibacteraeota bacterium]|jgi:CRP-like cAMP-binding protein|nr:cyclic nucleotide-binding domain-containing protein [Candidatus Dormibacteraeota bacterium]
MPEARGQLLAGVPLFSSLSDEERDTISRLSHDLERTPGEPVVHEGDDSGIGFYLILDGEAVVSRGGEEIGRLGPGKFFGELALLRRTSRMATVTAVTPLRLLSISAWNFDAFCGSNPAVGQAISATAREREVGDIVTVA